MFQDFQNQESMFINSVTKACYKNDKSFVHILAKQGNGKLYAIIPAVAANKTPKTVDNLIICRIDLETIEELNNEAGKEYWSLDWLKYVIRQMIDGESYMSLERFKRKINR
ncbi:hypothetical protein FZC76_20065 [Sutcliffiella horikoshii]|uniref:Uncharacterized protein n=1 Tax=Sutcliffiella horikoshii TaxID=79883 RepID=A0A5D4SJ97_9BACI|nr:hypothetical protein [Sutcliffiella horikoshii]TYS63515.1 hypothetical protein FZC76_20065 [Sutcliffiella horikoshii]